jgi:hypothetical protein
VTKFSRQSYCKQARPPRCMRGWGIDASAILGREAERAKTAPAAQNPPQVLRGCPRRLLYNYDAWSPFLQGFPQEEIYKNIDVFFGTQVTTVSPSSLRSGRHQGASLARSNMEGARPRWRLLWILLPGCQPYIQRWGVLNPSRMASTP